MTSRDAGAVFRPGHRPDGNRAHVEIVATSDLVPDDVVFHEGEWWCILDGDKNDGLQVLAAPIIDDSAGQDDSDYIDGSCFARVARRADDDAAREALLRECAAALEKHHGNAGCSVFDDGHKNDSALVARIDAALASRRA